MGVRTAMVVHPVLAPLLRRARDLARVIALGERDGIQAGAIAACARAAGAEVVLEKTYCFV